MLCWYKTAVKEETHDTNNNINNNKILVIASQTPKGKGASVLSL